MTRKAQNRIGIVAIVALLAWTNWQLGKPYATKAPVAPKEEAIPPGIVVTESSPAVPPQSPSSPGDQVLGGYGNPDQPPSDDLVLMSRAISGFLTIDKQATGRPLSANEEWSAALRGLRPGTERWISDGPPVFDSNHRLIDRWGTPLFFHALGGEQWEIRSAGPDRKPWTADDLMEKFSG